MNPIYFEIRLSNIQVIYISPLRLNVIDKSFAIDNSSALDLSSRAEKMASHLMCRKQKTLRYFIAARTMNYQQSR